MASEENFPRQEIFPDEIFPEKVIVFPKSVMTPSKIRTVINFYAKALKRFPGRCFRVSRGFSFHWSNYPVLKIILIGENSFLQTYCNKVKSFWKNSVDTLVMEV